jgi:thiamine biosynthesis protein ThiI
MIKEISPKKGILLAWGELFLKSPGVREIFKNKLIRNLSFFLRKNKIGFKIYPLRERIFVQVSEQKKAIKIFKNIFGISWFGEALFFERANLKEVSDFVAQNYQTWIKKNETFALRLKKGNEIQESAQKIIEKIAQKIERKVDLEKPKREIFVEARKEGWFLYFKKRKGAGGLPVGSGGKVLALISGGIDSVVASYLIAKRGAKNFWLHFHSYPLVSNSSIEKVKELAKIFLNYQPDLKIYLIPFSQIQLEIKRKILPKYRILLYRRTMFKIGQEIAKKENCLALVTGESLGQVSSQTLPNLAIIEKAVSLPILRPLIGKDKEEIISLAKKIGSYQISIKPQEDCCSLFTPKHATAQGNLNEVEKMEKKLNLKEGVKKILRKVEILNY